MEFAIGFFEALSALITFGTGAAVGWFLRGRTPYRNASPTPPDTEGQRVQEERDAFRRLQTYSVADAYGQNQEESL